MGYLPRVLFFNAFQLGAIGNIEYERDNLMLVDEYGDDSGIPKLRLLYLLEYVLGVHLHIPKLELLRLLVHLISPY